MAAPARPPLPDPGGPLLALCLGHRCSALRDLAGTAGTVDVLQHAVGTTRGAVLVTAGCLGPCSLAAVGAVAHRDGTAGCSGRTVWLSGLHEEDRADALAGWIGDGGPVAEEDPDAGLPVSLVPAVVGLGPPVRFGR